MGEISKLDWLIGFIKHAIWSDSLYFLYLLLLSISKILAASRRPYDPPRRHVGKTLFEIMAVLT
jgi:hypothetical protein